MTTSWVLSRESELDYSDDAPLAQFWRSSVTTGSFSGKHQVDIAYAWTMPAQPRGAIVLSSGRVETYLKYKEVMFDLANNGFAVFAIDHRGQGLSGRMTADAQHGYVADFDDYVADLQIFIERVIRPQWSKDLNLLCHSMGGAIGALTMLAAPELFTKAVLCSPMFGIKPALPNWLANTLIRAGLKKSQMKRQDSDYFFGQKPYTAYPFAVNPLTRSKQRYNYMIDLYSALPQLQLGGVTSQWLAAAHQAMNHIEAQAQRIQTPTLILSSGRDIIIDNRRQARVAAKFPQGQYQIIGGACHELFCEKDQYRLDAMARILTYLSE